MKKKTSLSIALVTLLIAGGYLAYAHIPREYFTLTYIQGLVESAGPFGPILYGLIYYVASILFLSMIVLSVGSGTLFGPIIGSVLTIIAATLGAQTWFLIARKFGAPIVDQPSPRLRLAGKLGKHEAKVIHGLMERIRKRLDHNGFRVFIILRCMLLPYMPLSVAAGLVREARARDFFLATLCVNCIYSPIFVIFGSQVLRGPRAFIVPGILTGIIILIPVVVKQVQKRQKG